MHLLFFLISFFVSLTYSKYLLEGFKRAKLESGSVKDQNQCTYGSIVNDTVIQLGDCEILFCIQLGIGSPPQYFYFQFDTGSNVLWVPTTQTNPSGFNIQGSSTNNITDQQYSMEYADGSGVVGDAGSDMVYISGTNINVTNSILFVTKQQKMTFPGSVIGIVGMGYTDLPNFLDVSYQQNKISTNTFALNLSISSSEPSLLFYNQLPSWVVSNTLYSSVYGSGYWQLQVVGVTMGNQDLTSYSVEKAVIDSGTTYFYLNPKLYEEIFSLYFQQSCITVEGINICPCSLQSNIPPLKILFQGVSVEIYPQDYFVSYNSSYCFAFIGTLADESTILLLGDTLFYNYIISFNKQTRSVGFCQNYEGDSVNGHNRKPTTVSQVGSQWFIIAQWVMMGFSIVIFLIFVYLLYHLRMIKNVTLRKKLLQNSNQGYAPSPNQNQYYGQPMQNFNVSNQGQINNVML